MQAIVLSLLRHFLTAAGTWAVAKGFTDAAGVEQIVGGVVALLAVAWGAVEKHQREA